MNDSVVQLELFKVLIGKSRALGLFGFRRLDYQAEVTSNLQLLCYFLY